MNCKEVKHYIKLLKENELDLSTNYGEITIAKLIAFLGKVADKYGEDTPIFITDYENDLISEFMAEYDENGAVLLSYDRHRN